MSTPEALRLAADLEAPGRVFSCSVVAAELRRQHAEIERLTTELAAVRALMPDDLFPGSKDWVQGDTAQRVDCLRTWLDDARAESSVAYIAFDRVSAERDALRERVIRDLEAAIGGVTGAICPPGQPGSYARGAHSGLIEALRIVRAALQQPKEPKNV